MGKTTWRCKHPRTPENTTNYKHKPQCRICKNRARARYYRSAKGKKAYRAFDARRIRYADKDFGHAETAEEAEMIKQHIRNRVAQFKETQNEPESRFTASEQTEGDPYGAMALEATADDHRLSGRQTEP